MMPRTLLLLRTSFRCAAWLIVLGLCQRPAAAATFVNTPATVSNTYFGTITLQIGGLTNGETVVVQQFLDANTNGVIEGSDWLVQQFPLTDGVASLIGSVTNINVPGDSTPTNGAITARMNFLTGGTSLPMAARYLYRLSSPTANFAPLTSQFNVTNFPYAQSIGGSVLCSGTNVPNALVMVFNGPAFDSTPVGAAMADNTGTYRIPLPPGTYNLLAFKTNYVGSAATAPRVTLGSGATAATNLSLLPTTCSISGRLEDAANPSRGLPGVWVFPRSSAGLVGAGFTDSAGDFIVQVTTGQWELGYDDMQLPALGYLAPEDEPWTDTSAGSVTGVTVSLPKGTALFYGTVKDGAGNPLPGVWLWADDDNDFYEAAGVSDQNGNYAVAVVAGDWSIGPSTSDSPAYANYVGPWLNSIPIADGQALRLDLVMLPATNRISGYLRDTADNPVSGVSVWAQTMIGGTNYEAEASSDETGHYTLHVCDGTWTVGLSCGDLADLGYECPSIAWVTIAGADAVTNFTVVPLPLVDVRSYSVSKAISFWQANASSLTLNTNHGPFTGTLSIVQSSPDSVPIATATLPDGEVRGFPRVTSSAVMEVSEMFSNQNELDARYGSGTYTFAMATRNNGFQFPELAMPVTVYPTNPPPQMSSFAAAQAIVPENPFTLQWNNPSDAAASDYVWVLIMDRDGHTVFSTPYPPVSPEVSLRGTDTWVEIPANTFHLGETYTGVIVFFRITGVNTEGYPGAFGLTLAIADTAFPMATISPVPVLSQPTKISDSQFGFLLSGIPGRTYSVLVATNPARPLTNWHVLLTTTLSGYSASIQDNQASNQRRFYRARLEP